MYPMNGRDQLRRIHCYNEKPARISYLIRQAQLVSWMNVAECLRDYRITSMQYILLSFSRRSGDLSAPELARRFAVAPQSMNEAISALQRKRLLSRKEAAEHRRIQRIGLTAERSKFVAEM